MYSGVRKPRVMCALLGVGQHGPALAAAGTCGAAAYLTVFLFIYFTIISYEKYLYKKDIPGCLSSMGSELLILGLINKEATAP